MQWRALMDTFFGTADAYSHNLAAIGHDAHEFVVNCEPLQLAWASEHGVRVNADGAEEAILLAQARDFEPDVVYVQHVHYLTDTTLAALKRTVGFSSVRSRPSRRISSGCGSFDLLVTCLPSFVTRFNADGVRTELLRLAFDERVLDELRNEEREPASATPSSSARSVEPSIGGQTAFSPGQHAECRSSSGATAACSGPRGPRSSVAIAAKRGESTCSGSSPRRESRSIVTAASQGRTRSTCACTRRPVWEPSCYRQR